MTSKYARDIEHKHDLFERGAGGAYTSMKMGEERGKFLCLISAAQRLSGCAATVDDISGFLGYARIVSSVEDRALCHHDCEFCGDVRNLPGGRLACIFSDLGEFGEESDAEWHECHAGLREMCVSMRYHGFLIARVFLGQRRAPDAGEARVRRALAGFPEASEEIVRKYAMLPVADEARMEDAALLLAGALSRFINEDIGRDTLEAYFSAHGALLSHRAAVYASHHLEKGIDARELAQAMRVSRDTLNRAFQRELKLTAAQYIDRARLSLACRLLQETGQSANTVAVNVGLRTPAYFSRWFRARTGASPAEYRARAAAIQIGGMRKNAARTADAPGYAERAKAMVESEFMKPIGVKALAKRMHISPEHLSRVFTARYGETLSECIAQRRMREACMLLSRTAIGLADVAARAGYSDESYFARRFRALNGVSPTEYREAHGREA